MLHWFSVMKKENRWAEEAHISAPDCPEHLCSPILSIYHTETAAFLTPKWKVLTYLAWVKNEEDGEGERAIIYQHLASANQEELTWRRGNVENQMVRPIPREEIKMSREQVICWQQKEVVGKGRNHSVDETNNIQSSRGVDVLKVPKCSWQAWNKPPVSFFLACFFFLKLSSYLTLLG